MGHHRLHPGSRTAITSHKFRCKKVPQEQKIQGSFLRPHKTAVDSDSAPLQVVPRKAQAKMKAGDPNRQSAAGAGIRSEKETEARTAEETEESNSSEDQVQVQAADPPMIFGAGFIEQKFTQTAWRT